MYDPARRLEVESQNKDSHGGAGTGRDITSGCFTFDGRGGGAPGPRAPNAAAGLPRILIRYDLRTLVEQRGARGAARAAHSHGDAFCAYGSRPSSRCTNNLKKARASSRAAARALVCVWWMRESARACVCACACRRVVAGKGSGVGAERGRTSPAAARAGSLPRHGHGGDRLGHERLPFLLLANLAHRARVAHALNEDVLDAPKLSTSMTSTPTAMSVVLNMKRMPPTSESQPGDE